MTAWLHIADDILRARTDSDRLPYRVSVNGMIVGLSVSFGLLYGFVMGCYDGGQEVRLLQALYSAVKVPLLLAATFALSLPSFFVVNTLMGLRGDFSQAVRALLTAQAGLTIILASLAPLTALWYVSTADYDLAILFNAGMFAVASLGAQLLLRRRYAPLICRHANHRWMMWTWLVIYAFVGIQVAWIARPFIGSPGLATRFFRQDAWSNAYVHLARIVWRLWSGIA
jgi:hypothetical protein